MVNLLSTNGQHSLVVEEELKTSSNCYCHWPLLYHPRQSIAVINAVTSVRVVLYPELSFFVKATSRLTFLEGLFGHWVSLLRGDAFDHCVGEDCCHPSSFTSLISKGERAVYDVLLREIELFALEEEGGLDIRHRSKGVARATCTLFFD